MDTSPDAPGENIRARITEPYDGGDIVLNEEKHIMLSPKEYPQLKKLCRQAPDRHGRHDAARRRR